MNFKFVIHVVNRSNKRLKNIEFVAEGGFSKIYKGTWIDGPIRSGETTVALKELNNSKNINSKDLNEVVICTDFFNYKF